MKIRDAVSADIPRVGELHLAVVAAMADIAPPWYSAGISEPPEPGEVHAELAEALASPECCLAVADSGQDLAGYVLCALEENGDDLLAAPFVTIVYLGVDEAWRGRGIARALVRYAEDWARRQKAGAVDLLVWEGNTAARKLYEELGYGVLELRMAKRL